MLIEITRGQCEHLHLKLLGSVWAVVNNLVSLVVYVLGYT